MNEFKRALLGLFTNAFHRTTLLLIAVAIVMFAIATTSMIEGIIYTIVIAGCVIAFASMIWRNK
jgi:hypothetical protein